MSVLFDKTGDLEAGSGWLWAPGELGSSLLASPVHLQIQRPVVKTSTEQLAQELEGLAQAQVRGKQGPHWAAGEMGDLGGRRGWEDVRAKAGD